MAKDSKKVALQTRSYLEVPAVHPDGCLRQRQVTDKAKVQWPDARMLRDRKSSERAVKCLPASCNLALRYKKLAVVQPYSGHLICAKEKKSGFDVNF